MAMVEMYEPEPEVETVTLGEADIVFEGPSLEEVGSDFAELLAMEVAAQINERFQRELSPDFGFSISGYDVQIRELTLEIESVFQGSIVARFKMIGAAVITSYGVVASYPSFKEAVPILAADIGKAITYVIERAPEPSENAPDPRRFVLYFRDEKEVLAEISDIKSG